MPEDSGRERADPTYSVEVEWGEKKRERRSILKFHTYALFHSEKLSPNLKFHTLP
jgi:hypothetical protein